MIKCLKLTLALLLFAGTAWANLGTLPGHGYAYPVPWSSDDGLLTLHFEDYNSNVPTFIIVDLLGEEITRLTGELVRQDSAEEYDGGETEYVFEAHWNGETASGRPVAAGTYLCFVEDIYFRFILNR
jgi:hypothetical protein